MKPTILVLLMLLIGIVGFAQDEEEEDIDESNSLVIAEEWETWYPQEWIGWCLYGVPSEKPTEFWVHQPVSNGPTDVE